MKKTFVRIAALAAAAMCAAPMALTANASTKTPQKRYHVKQTSWGRIGDVNGGGITGMDALDIQRYADPHSANPSNFNKKVADVNNDGAITNADATCVMQYIANPKTGDVNGDGKINVADAVAVTQFLYNDQKYPIANLLNADVNYDGIINTVDAKLIQIRALNIFTVFNIRWGDVNGDGNVNIADAVVIHNYYGQKWNTKTISADLFLRCDVNGDQKIDENDFYSIQNHCISYGFTETKDY